MARNVVVHDAVPCTLKKHYTQEPTILTEFCWSTAMALYTCMLYALLCIVRYTSDIGIS